MTRKTPRLPRRDSIVRADARGSNSDARGFFICDPPRRAAMYLCTFNGAFSSDQSRPKPFHLCPSRALVVPLPRSYSFSVFLSPFIFVRARARVFFVVNAHARAAALARRTARAYSFAYSRTFPRCTRVCVTRATLAARARAGRLSREGANRLIFVPAGRTVVSRHVNPICKRTPRASISTPPFSSRSLRSDERIPNGRALTRVIYNVAAHPRRDCAPQNAVNPLADCIARLVARRGRCVVLHLVEA